METIGKINEVPLPLFTLRGHDAAVTALCYYRSLDKLYLISGDENGNLTIWDLTVFKLLTKHKILGSKIQSLRSISLGNGSSSLVVQSRDDGVHILGFDSSMNPKFLTSFGTINSTFSRGDALTLDCGRAILAYPSLQERNLVDIRILGKDAFVEHSEIVGNEKNCAVFDILIKKVNFEIDYHLFIAYEDGSIDIYSLNLDPVNKLNVKFARTLNFQFEDFVSAFDVIIQSVNYIIVAGSPKRDLIFAQIKSTLEDTITIQSVQMCHGGVSAISVRPDKKLVAIACWDKTIKLYSMKSRKLLATLTHHSGRVQDLLFFPDPTLLCSASQEGTISLMSIY